MQPVGLTDSFITEHNMIQNDQQISLHDLVLAHVENPDSSYHRVLDHTIGQNEVDDFLRRNLGNYKTKNRFLLTKKATRMCSMMAAKDPELIIQMIDVATLPSTAFPMWCEWDQHDRLGAAPDETQDKIAGFLAWKEFATGDAVNIVTWGSADLTNAGGSLVGCMLWPKSGVEWKPALGNNEESSAIDRLDNERARLLGWNWIAQQQDNADIVKLTERVSWNVGTLTGMSFGRVLAKSYPTRMGKESISDAVRSSMDACSEDMRMAAAVLALKARNTLVEKKQKAIPAHHEKAGRINNVDMMLLDMFQAHEAVK